MFMIYNPPLGGGKGPVLPPIFSKQALFITYLRLRLLITKISCTLPKYYFAGRNNSLIPLHQKLHG